MSEIEVEKSEKGFVPTLLLAIFLGGLEVHSGLWYKLMW